MRPKLAISNIIASSAECFARNSRFPGVLLSPVSLRGYTFGKRCSKLRLKIVAWAICPRPPRGAGLSAVPAAANLGDAYGNDTQTGCKGRDAVRSGHWHPCRDAPGTRPRRPVIAGAALVWMAPASQRPAAHAAAGLQAAWAGTIRRRATDRTGMAAYTSLTASVSVTPASPGISRRPACSNSGAARSTSRRRIGGIQSARSRRSTRNRQPRQETPELTDGIGLAVAERGALGVGPHPASVRGHDQEPSIVLQYPPCLPQHATRALGRFQPVHQQHAVEQQIGERQLVLLGGAGQAGRSGRPAGCPHLGWCDRDHVPRLLAPEPEIRRGCSRSRARLDLAGWATVFLAARAAGAPSPHPGRWCKIRPSRAHPPSCQAFYSASGFRSHEAVLEFLHDSYSNPRSHSVR